MTAINFPPLCRSGRIFTDFAMCNCFSKNLGLGDAAKMDDVKALVDAVFPIGIPLPYPLADIP
ncbi:TPA: hypothetical protein ACPZOD_002985, partial [Yersinia enterocolitica]